MSESPETLGMLLDPEDKGVGKPAIAALDATPEVVAVRAALALVPSAARSDLTAGIAEAVGAVRQLKLGDILAGAWDQLRGYREAVEESRKSPADVVQKPIKEVEIASTLHPKVAVLVNGVAIPKADVEFTVALALEIEAGVLQFRGGRLTSVTLAKCTGKATLSCGKAVLWKGSTRELQLPTLSLPPG